jgi:6-phosphogluconolactonase
MKAYLGTYTKKESQGIYGVEIEDKKIRSVDLVQKIDSPTYVYQHHGYLFSVVKEADEGGIAFFNQGQLINQCVEKGAPPCYVYFDEKHQLVYSANYHGGRINTYGLNEEGLYDNQRIVFGEGSKAHYINYHPQLERVVVCDLGKDQVHFFEVQPDTQLKLKTSFNAPQGSGPRHAVNHPTEQIVYVFSELSSEVFVLKYEDDQVTLMQKVSALPDDYDGIKWGAAIRISQDGRYLYVSNRAHDSLTVFSVQTDFSLKMIQNISTYGVQPRDFNLSLDDALCLVANHDTNTLSLFERNHQTGFLSLLQKEVKVPEAVCVDFVK